MEWLPANVPQDAASKLAAIAYCGAVVAIFPLGPVVAIEYIMPAKGLLANFVPLIEEQQSKLLAKPNLAGTKDTVALAAEKTPEQEDFITEIRNSITMNMVFTTVESPIQFVDDLRSMTEEEERTTFDVNDTDVFMIFNDVDNDEAGEIVEMVGDIITMEKLNIIQDSDMDYSEYCTQQIDKSKLVVVFFKETAEWALPFTQQIWKRIGGASSHTPILLIGDQNPDTNFDKAFKAPKVISLIVSGELIPLEIKVQYDQVQDGTFGGEE
ncbi:MAG: hypothetical protein IH946_07385 [Bacteroidetes bacterium]|nr:hypothetical protein [Bacteroidota bacterium]